MRRWMHQHRTEPSRAVSQCFSDDLAFGNVLFFSALGRGNTSHRSPSPRPCLCAGGHAELSQIIEHLFVCKAPSLLLIIFLLLLCLSHSTAVCFQYVNFTHNICLCPSPTRRGGRKEMAFLEYIFHLVLNHHGMFCFVHKQVKLEIEWLV